MSATEMIPKPVREILRLRFQSTRFDYDPEVHYFQCARAEALELTYRMMGRRKFAAPSSRLVVAK